ncbi:MAG TPA: SGNH/GDSL hydrolase family protein [Terriglobales bacterium]|jgi:lysophospholipase L1-like esterase|nr:SGNH/GDSL hydrolase family protein [Terriglobales bacterium]
MLRRSLLGLISLLAAVPVAAQPAFYLHQDDRVVFYGDSITQFYQYNAFVETYVVSRWPGLNIRFINAGWSGDWVVGGGGGTADERLARDVVANRATVATVMVGMNDGAYQKFDQAFFDVYTKGYEHLLDVLHQSLPGLRVTLLQPSPYDDVTHAPEFEGGYNAVIARYGQFVGELSKRRNFMAVDFNAPLVAVLQKANATDPVVAAKIIPDRIHPAAAGGLVMAAALLKAWNAAPVVTSVELDARRGRVERSENTVVSDIQKGDVFSWIQLDQALPLPIDTADPVLALVVKSSDVVETLDQETLRVTGLRAGTYLLKIDGIAVGPFTAEQLNQGTNLALLPTPMLKQALDVYALTMRRNDVRITAWQNVQYGLRKETSPHVVEATAALNALEEDILAQQRQAAVPQPHHYELVRQEEH